MLFIPWQLMRSGKTVPGSATNGRPLYTYVGDTVPGQAFGNNLNLNGGLWHEMTVPS
jgi:predicted lipoprotein with Yx(FWY)xxD motif